MIPIKSSEIVLDAQHQNLALKITTEVEQSEPFGL